MACQLGQFVNKFLFSLTRHIELSENSLHIVCVFHLDTVNKLFAQWKIIPGGKVEQGETKEQALIRECQEELTITISVDDVFMDVVHEYPDITVHLTLFNATIAEGVPQKLEHNDIKWITPVEIPQYGFCPADEEILAKIIRTYSI